MYRNFLNGVSFNNNTGKRIIFCLKTNQTKQNLPSTTLLSPLPLLKRYLCSNSHKIEQEIKQETDNAPEFPGMRTKFTNNLKFLNRCEKEDIPAFRVLDCNGNFLSKQYENQLDLNLMKRFYRGKLIF